MMQIVAPLIDDKRPRCYTSPNILRIASAPMTDEPLRAAIPGRPFKGPNAPQRAYKHLERFHGIDPKVASNRLHRLKHAGGLAPNDDVVIGRTGDVYNAINGERLGSLTDPTFGP